MSGPAPAVILCRTQMGENIGTAARAMLNFGLERILDGIEVLIARRSETREDSASG